MRNTSFGRFVWKLVAFDTLNCGSVQVPGDSRFDAPPHHPRGRGLESGVEGSRAYDAIGVRANHDETPNVETPSLHKHPSTLSTLSHPLTSSHKPKHPPTTPHGRESNGWSGQAEGAGQGAVGTLLSLDRRAPSRTLYLSPSFFFVSVCLCQCVSLSLSRARSLARSLALSLSLSLSPPPSLSLSLFQVIDVMVISPFGRIDYSP